MPDSVTVKIPKKARLIAKFRALRPAVNKGMADASMKGAEAVAGHARMLVAKRTGHLASTINAIAQPERLGAMVVAGDATTLVEVREGSGIFTNIARLVEFGTKRHRNKGKFAGSWHPGTRAQPFFWPAYRIERKRIKARMGRAIGKAARAVAGSGS